MRRSVVALTLAGLMVPLSPASAQDRPDFSGRWTTGPAPDMRGLRAGPSGSMGSGWGADIVVAQGPDTMIVESLIFSGGDLQPPLKYRYALAPGSRTVNQILMGYDIQEFPTTTRWEGGRLVLTTTHTFQDPRSEETFEADVTRVMWLEFPNSLVRPPSLIVEMTIEGLKGGPPSTSRTVYTSG
jgi:hypothetical protein